MKSVTAFSAVLRSLHLPVAAVLSPLMVTANYAAVFPPAPASCVALY
jgi:hypothetical protein